MLKFSQRDFSPQIKLPKRNVIINNTLITCYNTLDQSGREKGLQHIYNLPRNYGMLFECFNRYRPYFHMRNVYMNLDAIFVSNNNKIIEIVPMYALDGSAIYTTHKNVPVKYVIEVNYGFCAANKIKEGDNVLV